MVNILRLFNANVYLTNMLLLPCVIFAILTYSNTLYWSPKVPIYSTFWLIISFILGLTTIFSNVHHIYMFGKNQMMQQIGNIDKKMAPFLGIIIVFLNLLYMKYLYDSCENINNDLKNITIPIYIISLIYSSIGLLSFFIKKKFLPKSHDLYESLYITAHTFFHYMTYSGMILLFLLYYVENQDIYSAIFDKCK